MLKAMWLASSKWHVSGIEEQVLGHDQTRWDCCGTQGRAGFTEQWPLEQGLAETRAGLPATARRDSPEAGWAGSRVYVSDTLMSPLDTLCVCTLSMTTPQSGCDHSPFVLSGKNVPQITPLGSGWVRRHPVCHPLTSEFFLLRHGVQVHKNYHSPPNEALIKGPPTIHPGGMRKGDNSAWHPSCGVRVPVRIRPGLKGVLSPSSLHEDGARSTAGLWGTVVLEALQLGEHILTNPKSVCECPVLWLSCENKLSFKLVLRANSFQLLIITEKETFKTRKLIHFHIVFLAPDILVPTCRILGKQ